MSKKAMSWNFEDDITIAKNLYKHYTLGDLLEAVLLYETRYRLKNKYKLDEKTIEENYEKLEDMIFTEADIFNYDEIDKVIDKYFKLKNNQKKGI